ncbi:MAG TPA: AMP-binding protein [Hyphomicrobiales bacterium]|nr:AMP-binding protein [Hyphomicrobiales bacterium]
MFDLGRTFLASVARHPNRLAIVDGDKRLSYREWLALCRRLAGGLDALGLKKGDRLVSILQNRWEAATLHWATQLAGIVITPVNWRAKADELDRFVRDADAAAVIFEDISAEAAMSCEAARTRLKISLGERRDGTYAFNALLDEVPAEARPRATAEDLSLMFYTSGTTGPGKGVPRRHRAERMAALAHIAQNQYAFHEVTLGAMPLYHTMGVRSLLSMAIINGTFVCQRRFDAGEALELIEREGVSALYLVPTLYHDLLAHPHFHKCNLTSVKKLGFAGASMTEGLLKRVDEAFRPQLFVNHYGSSEIYTFTIEPQAAKKPGSAGKAGLNTEVRIVKLGSDDPDEVVPSRVEGQIAVTLDSDEAFEGYWRRPEADAKAIHAGWYFTGDIGFADEDGDIFVTGRVDDMIITGGENVLPGEIESVLSLHPAVGEVAVCGLPHERLGQAVTAFIKAIAPVTEAELDAWCLQSSLAGFKRPRRYMFVTAIPKSPVGKILRRKLIAGEFETAPTVPG